MTLGSPIRRYSPGATVQPAIPTGPRRRSSSPAPGSPGHHVPRRIAWRVAQRLASRPPPRAHVWPRKLRSSSTPTRCAREAVRPALLPLGGLGRLRLRAITKHPPRGHIARQADELACNQVKPTTLVGAGYKQVNKDFGTRSQCVGVLIQVYCSLKFISSNGFAAAVVFIYIKWGQGLDVNRVGYSKPDLLGPTKKHKVLELEMGQQRLPVVEAPIQRKLGSAPL